MLVIGQLAAAQNGAGALLVELVGQAGQRGRGAAQVADQRIGFGDRRLAEGLQARPRIGDRAFERLHRFVRRGERVAQIGHGGIDIAVDRPLRCGGEIADLFGGDPGLLDRDARVGERAFDGGAVAREDRGRGFDIVQDAAHARLIFIVGQLGQAFGQRRQALEQLRRGVEQFAQPADARRDDGLARRSLVGDRRRALDRAVERNLRHAGKADALDRRGRALQHRDTLVHLDADADELRIVGPQRDLAHLSRRDARELHRGPLVQPVDRLFEKDVIFALLAAAVIGEPDDEKGERCGEEQDKAADEDVVRASFHQLFLSPLRGLVPARRSAATRSVEIILYPRMLGGKQFRDGADRDHLLFREHRDAVAGGVKRIEVVGDQEDGEPHRVGQLADQLVEFGGADRVEPRGRFVEEQQRGIEREAARKTGALDHAARQLGGIFRPGIGGQPDHRDLVGGDFVEQFLVGARIKFAQRHLDILGNAQRREQRAALEHHAPAAAQVARFFFVGDGVERLAIDLDLARRRGLEADDRAHQHRFAGARSADDAEDFARPHVEVEMVVDDCVAELVDEAANADRIVEVFGPHRVGGGKLFGNLFVDFFAHQFHPIDEKKTANIASSTMTRKIAATTAEVVRLPTSSAFWRTCMPS